MQGDGEEVTLEEGKEYLNKFIGQIKRFLETGELAVSNGKLAHLGYINGPQPIPQLADVVLVPSVVDHFPNLLIECGALGVPMLLSDIKAHRNIFPEHPAFFPLSSAPDEVVNRMSSLHRLPQERFRIAKHQQLAISSLRDAWGEPLRGLFEDK